MKKINPAYAATYFMAIVTFIPQAFFEKGAVLMLTVPFFLISESWPADSHGWRFESVRLPGGLARSYDVVSGTTVHADCAPHYVVLYETCFGVSTDAMIISVQGAEVSAGRWHLCRRI